MIKTADGLFRYQRRVPQIAQDDLRRKVWNLSLGRDERAATNKARTLELQHDHLLNGLRDTATKPAVLSYLMDQRVSVSLDRAKARITLLEATNTPEGDFADTEFDPGREAASVQDILDSMWKATPDNLRDYRDDPETEYFLLSRFLQSAFNDPPTPPTPDHPVPAPPTDPVDKGLYDAYKGMLQRRLADLSPGQAAVSKNAFSAILQKYKAHQGLTDSSSQSNEKLTLYFPQRDTDVAAITVENIRDYRDSLVSKGTLEATTIATHLSAVRTILGFAVKEGLIPDNPAKNIQGPKDKKNVDARKYKPFSQEEGTALLAACEAKWSPTAKTRITQERRKTLLMAVRVLAHTGMRPMEYFALADDCVTPDGVDIRVSKTPAGQRMIPVPTAISDFPAYVAAGGLADGRMNSEIATALTDKFRQILRAQGITDPQKVLYSWRSSAVTRMRATPRR